MRNILKELNNQLNKNKSTLKFQNKIILYKLYCTKFQELSRLRMASEQVKLFGVWESPFSKRVEIALKMKEVEYEYIEVDLEHKSPEILKYNPVHKLIPILLHNGKPIVESMVILEYIDETWKSGTPLLPSDPLERANVRFWDKFVDEKVHFTSVYEQ